MDEQGNEGPSEEVQRRTRLVKMGLSPECAEAAISISAVCNVSVDLGRFQKALLHSGACDACARATLLLLTAGMITTDATLDSCPPEFDRVLPRDETPLPERKRGRGKRARMPLRRSRR